MDLYVGLKFIHVLSAIVAFGWNASYGLWLARASREPQATQLFTLKTVKLMDDRVANPLYGVLLVTGLAMVLTAGYPLTTLWIAAALALYAVALIIAFTLVTPNFREAIRALEADGAESPAFRAAMARGRVVGPLIGVVVLAIVFLMVVKPTLG